MASPGGWAVAAGGDHHDGAQAKTAYRRELLARRAARPAGDRAAAAAAITDALLAGLAGARTIAAYAPEPVEPGAPLLPAALDRLDARVLLPVIPATGRQLQWAVATAQLVAGRYGLLEPVGPRFGPSELATADVVVVPALAVSRAGVRLGRGGGYYDRALQHARPDALLVALVFDDELVDHLPAEPHDQPVSAVVTPSTGWLRLPAPPAHADPRDDQPR
ncbi:5-formyltetrahydrofolate cyclo-ligase [Modestobacter roseus]|uniref:5-formyltetrahydrofolate cyclo-ligase n=1 Tax=Modestobacter roseus TaxID=1181884 RepID=A0A562IQX8_9ACTN|nr:5-formyltetrahydrofolate cyclo-ligase [Modestobacter roseus]MQA32020.1 5-formyltetrahydrofolate cyclo-ligase [Modestobacter roseus]TWH73449.1 5-formyltetrahydrofolate cyclo-ligase [Modestobacter roseus]